MGYDFEIQFRPGKTNNVADSLSRHPDFASISVNALILQQGLDWTQLYAEIRSDPVLCQLRKNIEAAGGTLSHYTLAHDLILYKSRTVLPRLSPHIPKLLYMYHDSPLGGHNGEYKTYFCIWRKSGFGRACGSRFLNMFVNVLLANDRKLRTNSLRGCYNLFHFQIMSGMRSLWILWRPCRNPMVLTLCSLWLIASQSMLILFLWSTLLRLSQWPRRLFGKLFIYMVFPLPSSRIGTRS